MTASENRTWTALIAVTTCNRDRYVRRCLPPLARAVNNDPRLALLVSLDGTDPATREICWRWRVPLLHSERREGVGLSKNRVLATFPEFDYYFFIEDDAELIDESVFAAYVSISRATGIHHMSLFQRDGVRQPVGERLVCGHRVVHALYGGADFNFFTREGLRQTGGWHPLFAEYRRWGHTEHSYRFPRAGLAPAPFNVVTSLSDSFIWHAPASVTTATAIDIDVFQIARPERDLMDLGLVHVPVQTLAPFHFNEIPFGASTALAKASTWRNPYPLLKSTERRQAFADYLVWRFEISRHLPARAAALLGAASLDPRNVALRHAIKTRVVRLLSRITRGLRSLDAMRR